MSSKTTRLSPSNAPLPTITPHLMPFHIEHTGSAPISTYFTVKPAPHDPQRPDSAASSGPGPSITQRIKTRFTSAFRGRKMEGLTVNLPDGYSGVALQAEQLGLGLGLSKETAPRKRDPPPKAKGLKGKRTTRSSTRNKGDDIEEDGDVTMERDTLKDDNSVIHILRPTARFSSFTLWNADIEADEGRDEYLRALSEYQQLLTQIHRIDL